MTSIEVTQVPVLEPPIVIVIGGQRFELTRDEARALRDGIEAIIGPKVSIRHSHAPRNWPSAADAFVSHREPTMIEVSPKGNQA